MSVPAALLKEFILSPPWMPTSGNCGTSWIGSRSALETAARSTRNLLQIRTKVLNNQLRETFVRWYPGMQNEQELEIQKKAA